MATAAVPAYDPTFANLGKPTTGNTGVANPNNGVRAAMGGFIPGASPTNSGGLVSQSSEFSRPNGPQLPVGVVQPMAATSSPLLNTGTVPIAGVSNPVASSPVSVVNGATGTSPNTAPVTPQEQKQLTDIYGQGTGNLLASEISNLGSDNSSYIQAYENAMAGTNAENLATLNTTLGNEGVSANSSTAAIENADFEQGVTSQEGLQEQQLQMNDLNQLLGLTEATLPSSQQEVSSGGFLNDFGSVLGAVGSVAGPLLGTSGLAGLFKGGSTSLASANPSLYAQSQAPTGLVPTDPTLNEIL